MGIHGHSFLLCLSVFVLSFLNAGSYVMRICTAMLWEDCGDAFTVGSLTCYIFLESYNLFFSFKCFQVETVWFKSCQAVSLGVRVKQAKNFCTGRPHGFRLCLHCIFSGFTRLLVTAYMYLVHVFCKITGHIHLRQSNKNGIQKTIVTCTCICIIFPSVKQALVQSHFMSHESISTHITAPSPHIRKNIMYDFAAGQF